MKPNGSRPTVGRPWATISKIPQFTPCYRRAWQSRIVSQGQIPDYVAFGRPEKIIAAASVSTVVELWRPVQRIRFAYRLETWHFL